MDDKTTCQILLDRKLEKLLNPPVKTNTFIKSYYEGLVFVFPTSIVITKARNTLFSGTSIGVTAKIVLSMLLRSFPQIDQ